ncbi:MAG: AAA family ATPase, partial [Candidatus Dojkabacteria bacterium]|nr:AAA family ATPase [Candidatus Dojkabacteria bacterium]
MSLELSEKQKSILDDILGWYKKRDVQYITLGGYAGTGKTTLMGYLSNILRNDKSKIKVAFCSYTGKASRVLQRKLRDTKSIYPHDYTGTIHRLIYRPMLDDEGEIIGWRKEDINQFFYDLIIVDEASMVTEDIWNDLLSFGKPILAVGDHGQLPPVEGNFNLMEKPQFKLEEIYRQELDNPIIKVSEIARKYGNIPVEEFSKTVKKLDKKNPETGEFLENILEQYDNDTMVLTGYNTSRVKLNKGIRQLLGFESIDPALGDRVICLKNNHEKEIYNGMMGTVLDISKNSVGDLEFFDVEIEFDDEDYPYLGKISREQFNKENSFNSISDGFD